jgi:hypothetical protein
MMQTDLWRLSLAPHGRRGATSAAVAPSTTNVMTTKRMMMITARKIVEVMTTMQFDWPCCTFTGPFGRQIRGGKGGCGDIGGASSTERVVKC